MGPRMREDNGGGGGRGRDGFPASARTTGRIALGDGGGMGPRLHGGRVRGNNGRGRGVMGNDG